MDRQWAVVDLDGTISNCSGRVHLAREAVRSDLDLATRLDLWNEFHKCCGDDPPYPAELLLLQLWQRAGHRLAILSGRSDAYALETRAWLARHNLTANIFCLRAPNDQSRSVVYKRRTFSDVILPFVEGYDTSPGTIAFFMEDQDRLVDLWRSLGYTCLQPRPSVFGDRR